MNLFACVIMLAAQPVPTLYIRVTDNFASRLLVSELTRDWTQTAAGEQPSLKKWNRLANGLRVEFLPELSDRALDPDYVPHWSFNRFGTYVPYERKALSVSTWPLLYTQWIVQQHVYERVRYEWDLETSWYDGWDEEEGCYIEPPSAPLKPWEPDDINRQEPDAPTGSLEPVPDAQSDLPAPREHTAPQ